MADIFEDRPDLAEERQKLFHLIDSTPHLDWLLLTKRPENIRRLNGWGGQFPTNVWLGTTVELQEYAPQRLDALLENQSVVHFASCEPLLGPLDLSPWLAPSRLNWLITGGESGKRARPMAPAWARALRDQCAAAGVPFHFKQWGDWAPVANRGQELARVGKKAGGRILDKQTWDGFPRPRLRP
jgi:protein gp37